MTRLRLYLVGWPLLLLGAAACSVTADEVLPQNCAGNFSLTLIEQLKQKPKQTPAAEITQYTYQGRTVYLVTGGDPSNYSYLFDNCGNVVCAAAGGTNNTGDGRCADFAATATNRTLIWRDQR
ncbi:hypothetical protein KLP40_17655 [Hymenobacter sp. NST-14]|uniref:DUF6970 domain-containing protein n=1 Tax=Hymenobacter piscis TaxID=2839984 RepID=UPI001C02686F|nr:hypothetical protein [Hymenobacter piscis]MBT9394996.1 hypothetical protein [Hymenobacter piscis]